MNRSAVAAAFLVAAAATTLLLHRSCPSGPGSPVTTATPTASPTPDRARLVAGLIVRDQATQTLIEQTSETPLPRDAGSELHLEVIKSAYRLEVWRAAERTERIKVYPIALGGEPEGAKQRQGDQRTPEGTYTLLPHHPSPSFGPCFYVCYPNRHDVERGLTRGLVTEATASRILDALDRRALPPHDTRLGGLILIHGTRNRAVRGLTLTNWTLGCIAMENRHIVELLQSFTPSDRPQVRILSIDS